MSTVPMYCCLVQCLVQADYLIKVMFPTSGLTVGKLQYPKILDPSSFSLLQL